MGRCRRHRPSHTGSSGCVAFGVDGDDLLHQAAAGRSHQAQLVPIMDEGGGENAGLLQKIAIEPQCSHHVACIVRGLGESLSLAVQSGEGLNHRLHTLPVGGNLAGIATHYF